MTLIDGHIWLELMRIALLGECNPSFEPHVATDAAIRHAATRRSLHVEFDWVSTADISTSLIEEFQAVWKVRSSMSEHHNHLGQLIGRSMPDWVKRPRPPRSPMTGHYCRVEPLDPDAHAERLYQAYTESINSATSGFAQRLIGRSMN